MRILLLTQIVPFPPDSGPRIKTYNVLRYLAQRHTIHLVSFVRGDDEERHARVLRDICASVTTVSLRRSRPRDIAFLARSLVTGRPFLIERDDSSAMHEAIAGLLRHEEFDAAHADQLSMAQFAVRLPVPIRVLDAHNAVWTIVQRAAKQEGWRPKRLLAELEWRKLRAYEGQVCQRFDLVTVVSPEDYAALAEAARRPFPAQIIPIAVDTEVLRIMNRAPEARHIVSVATMFYPPNAEGVHWFATRVFPLIRKQVKDTLFHVVGSRPPCEITALASQESGIIVTGYVADLDPILRQCAVMVVPLHSGSGMRVKILESFARGIPVVSTTVGVEGIDARPGEHLLVADTPQEFANAVVQIVSQPAVAAQMAERARTLVETKYNWQTALKGLDKVYKPNEAAAITLTDGVG